jgi:hypothetical protein
MFLFERRKGNFISAYIRGRSMLAGFDALKEFGKDSWLKVFLFLSMLQY